MATNPVNLSSLAFCSNSLLIEDHAPGIYAARPTLYSVKNNDRLTKESNRARRNVQVKNNENSPRDFTACFQSSSKTNDPYIVASHMSSVPLKRRPVAPTPTFALAQSLRWNPIVETSSIEDVSHAERYPNHNCKCNNCSTRNCPSKTSCSTPRSGSHRNNIMTFADICTMTPKVTDVGCGSSILLSTQASEASASGSDIAVRDTCACLHIDQSSCQPRCQQTPVPILKNSRRRCEYNDYNTAGSNCSENDHSTQGCYDERDDYDCESSRVCSIRSFLRNRKKKKERSVAGCHVYNNTNRRMIYNEGISDMIANRCPVKSSRNTVYYDEEANQIPHSHMANSRYHKNCNAKTKTYFYDKEGACRTIPHSPKLRPRVAPCSKPINFYQASSIKLPKKVLTSEMNIESYVESKCRGARGRPKW